MTLFFILKNWIAPAALALAFAASSGTSALAAPEVGTSAGVRGEVFVTTSGAQRKVAVRQSIKLQDQVLTKDDSALQILLLDSSTFTVGQNARVTIDRFVYDPDTSAGKISARVAKGAFRFMSGKIGRNSPTDASLTTPSATIGIRGTFLEGIIAEDAVALARLAGLDTDGACIEEASIVVLRGPGRRRNTLDRSGTINVSNSAGSALLSQPNYAVFVPCSGIAPVGPFSMTTAMQDYLDFFLRSEPNGPPVNPGNEENTGGALSGQTDRGEPVGNNDDVTEDFEDVIRDDVVVPEEEPIEDPYEEDTTEEDTTEEDPTDPTDPTNPTDPTDPTDPCDSTQCQ
ncbi:MAG: FecR family protein [Rhizobiaceae bacterium]